MTESFGQSLPHAENHEEYPRPGRVRQNAAILAALIGITFSVIACILVGSWEGERRKFDFERLAEMRCLLFENKANRHLDKLKALGQFYNGSQFVDRDEFIQFTAPLLMNHPEIHALGWAPRITHVNRSDFERTLQVEGLADCKIHDNSHLVDTAVAPDREEYYPIQYRSPQLDSAMLLDIFAIPHWREAIKRARDLGQLAIASPVVLPDEQDNELAVLALQPVYEKDSPTSTIDERRAAIRGVVFSAVRVVDILSGIIWKQEPRGTDIQVIDLSSPPGEQLLCQHWARLRNWETSDSLLDIDNSTNLRYVTSFEVADRTWEMRCTPSPGYLDAHSLWIHWVILLGGLALTALITTQLMLMRNRTSFVEALVDERTAELRESRKKLRNIIEHSTDMFYSHTPDHVLTYLSPQVEQILGYKPEEAMVKWMELTSDNPINDKGFEITQRAIETGQPQGHYELELKHKSGRKVWVEIREAPLVEGEKTVAVVGAAIDITERKKAEEKLRERAHQQSLAARFGQLALSGIELDELFEKAVSLVSETLGTKYAKVLEHIPDQHILFLRAGVGWKQGWVGQKSVPDGADSQGRYTLLQEKPVIAEDIENETRFRPPVLLTEHNAVGGITVAIGGRERPFGVLGVHTDRMQRFTEDDAHFMETIANVLAEAIQRQHSNEQLRSERDYSTNIIKGTPTVICGITPDGITVFINPAGEEVSGYRYEEIVGRNWWKTLFPGDEYRQVEHLFHDFEMGKIQEHEMILTRKDGEKRTVAWNSINRIDGDGKIAELICFGHDITERKQAEDALMESRTRYRALFKSAGNAIFMMDGEQFIDCNPKTLEMFGCTRDQIIGKPPYQFSPKQQPDGRNSQEKAMEKINLALSGESQRFEWLYCRHDSTPFHAEVSLNKINLSGKLFLQAIVRDITEQKQAKTLLQAERDYSSNIIQSMPGLSYVIEKDSGLLQSRNDNWTQVTGYSEEELQLMTFLDFFEEGPERDKCARRMQEVYDKGWSSMENLLVTKEGMKTPYYFTGRRATVEGRTYLVGLGIDITERKQAEEALRKSESQYDELFSSLLEGIVVVDENEMVTFCNPAYASIFEEDDPEKMIGKSLLDYTDSDQKEIILQQTACRLRGESSQYELEITTAMNNQRILLASVSPRLDENGRYIGAFGNVIDITETKRLQALESRAGRLETAGKIAGQVAHDFNNLLGPLMAYPDMIRDDLPNNHPALIYLDDIESAAEKISDINQDLLAMGRRGHYNQEVINLNRIVSHAINVIDTRSSTISCETDLCDDLMNVMGGVAQIDRCISNLLCNAQDALHGVGTITVKTENYYVDDVSIVYGHVPKGEYVKVTISDTGCGIPDDIIQKIFDPFFTSKTADKKRGSGLGLSVVDAVVKDHHGYIDLSSKVGEGASFYLYFPITRETVDKQESVRIIGGTEKILIIDDDEVQRDVSITLLKKLGYNVSAVESGEKAIEFLKDNPQDLLVLDMVMPPGMDGAETYRLISRIYPGQKSIIASGFSESGLVLWAQALGAGAFIRKPFTRATIGAAIRTELDRVKPQLV